MASMYPPKKNTAFTLCFTLYKNDGTIVANPGTYTKKVSIDGGDVADIAAAVTEENTTYGQLSLVIAAGEMNGDWIWVYITDDTAGTVPFTATFYTAANTQDEIGAIIANIHDTDLPAVKSDTAAILADTGTDGVIVASIANGAVTAAAIANAAIDIATFAADCLTSGALKANVESITAGAITAAAIATDAIDDDALAANAVSAIQSGLATPTNITAGTITTVTNLTNLPAAAATAAELAKVPKSDSTVSWNATALAAINAEADTALADYDGPTNAEMVARTLAAAAYFDPAADAVANVTTVGSVSGAVGSVTGAVGSVTGAVGSVTGAVASVTGAVGSVTGNVGGNVVGSVASVAGAVASVTAGVTVTTNNDKTGYALSALGIQAVWDALSAALVTAGSIGKRLVDYLTGDVFARIGAPVGVSISADVAAVKSDTAAILTDTGTTLDALIQDIPTVAEFNARTLVAADYTVVGDLPSVPTAAANADAVWDEAIADHAGAGSTGAALSAATAPSAATVADAVWDEAIGGHVVAGSTAVALAGASAPTVVQVRQEMDANSTKLANLDATVGSRLASAGYTAPDNASVTAIKLQTDKLQFAAVTNDVKATLDSETVALTAGHGLALEANVEGHVTTALNAYDPPTNAEMVARTIASADYVVTTDLPSAAPTASAIADAVWDETIAGHVAAGSTGNKLNGLAASSGAGAISWPITITSAGNPVDGAEVWVTTDSAGTNVAASGATDAAGLVTFMLDAGTYYVWIQAAGHDFTQGATTVVS